MKTSPTIIQPVILFDGVCNFCNSTINFVIKNDKKNEIKFAAIQSNAGKQLLAQYSLPPDDLQSFVFIENGVVYKRSTAAFRVCKYLGGVWKLGYSLLVIPAVARDAVYNFVAKNRYKWFGKKEKCMIPSPAVRSRFLE